MPFMTLNTISRMASNPFTRETFAALSQFILFLPLVIAHSKSVSVSTKSTLLFTGSFNLLFSTVLPQPLTFQPLPILSSISLSRHLTLHEHMGASITHGFILFLVSILARKHTHSIARYLPNSVIQGLRLGAGVLFILQATTYLINGASTWTTRWSDNIPLALIAFTVLCSAAAVPLITSGSQIKSSQCLPLILVTVLGLTVSTVGSITKFGFGQPFHFLSHWPTLSLPLPGGFIAAGLPQLLVTIADISELAGGDCHLAPNGPSVTLLGFGTGLFNVIGAMFNAMPVGLSVSSHSESWTPQILGISQIVAGLTLSTSFTTLIAHFPDSVLGVAILAVGVYTILNGIEKSGLMTASKSNGYTLLGTPVLISPASSTPDLPSTLLSSPFKSSSFTMSTIYSALVALATGFTLVLFRDGTAGFAVGFGMAFLGWFVRSLLVMWRLCRDEEARGWIEEQSRRLGKWVRGGAVSL